jgi:hypothetical protein
LVFFISWLSGIKHLAPPAFFYHSIRKSARYFMLDT